MRVDEFTCLLKAYIIYNLVRSSWFNSSLDKLVNPYFVNLYFGARLKNRVHRTEPILVLLLLFFFKRYGPFY